MPAHIDLIGSFAPEEILGMGRTGLVVRQGEFAVKLPLTWKTSSDEEVEANIETLQDEQAIYQRLGDYDGIVSLVDFSTKSTRLRLMKNGDLRSYLSQQQQTPPRNLQLSWFRTMARTLAYIHDQRVLVSDIASRNFLLDSDLSIKFCDFTEAIKLPLDSDMATADYGGYCVQTDIGQLGAVLYEVVAGEKCEFDIFKYMSVDDSRGTWPRREDLPSTEGIWLRQIIEKCWTQGAFDTAHDLWEELESVGLELRNEPDRIVIMFSAWSRKKA
ncbi:serine/threonine protein kinase [Aspergillus ellipticus CBS 707.79]|uniref:Serine/threonine protein kinase n=1 Tax=Aspergillus ellipticus CBS 707.79 TaxID=1448320 RepID=A0A319DEQ2_9EURO|nr:serine/threonine protein kinase [Aspergillus ellipticus CBS 707.79]